MWLKIVLVLLFKTISPSVGQDNILFRDENLEIGSPCRTSVGVGTCVLNNFCKNPSEQLLNDQNSICFFHEHRTPVICCPVANINNQPVKPVNPVNPVKPFNPTTKPTSSFNSALTNLPRLSQVKCQDYSHNYTDGNGYYGIVLGTNAGIAEFPHMAVMGYPDPEQNRTFWYCGGTLISERYILTAAHCFGRLKPNVIRLGERDLSSDDDNEDVRDFGIESVTIHPEYKPQAAYNDIALVRLDNTARFTRFIRPACLSLVEDPGSVFLTATGWGDTSFGGSGSQVLQKVDLKYFPTEKCKENYQPSRRIQQGLIGTQLCAGSISNDESDTCQGDSGGPLTHTTYNKEARVTIFHVAGVTSFGKGCGFKVPAVYTRVSSFIDWIEPVVWN